jgi:hypothetical protein
MEEYTWQNAKGLIRNWRQEKEDNEFRLAEKLFEYFTKEPMRRMLSIISYHAIKELTEEANESDLKKFLEETKDKYRFFRKEELLKRAFKNYPGGDDLLTNRKKRSDIFARILKEKRTKYFDPGDNADILCMYGEFIEEVGKGEYKKSAKYFTPKYKDKKRITHESHRRARRKPRVSKDWKAADGKVVEFFKKGDREKVKISGKHRRIRAFRDSLGKDKRRAALEKYKPMMANGKYPGGALFQLDEASSIKQIDRMFGLMKMADISGTTADTVFGMEVLWHHFHAGTFKSGGEWTEKKIAAWVEDALRMKEVLYLLPLVTMTYQAHHSLLECAFTLSLNDYIDYSVGVYGSLRPQYWKDQEYEVETGKVKKLQKGKVVLGLPEKEKKIAKWAEPKTKEFRDAVKKLEEIVKEHEGKKENHLLLCYFDDAKSPPKGVYVFDKKNKLEKKVFERCANIKANMRILYESTEGEKIAGWASELYSEDLDKRYPSEDLLVSTLVSAAIDSGCWVDVEYPKVVGKGKPVCKYKITPIEGELREEGRPPAGLEDY